MDRLSHKFKIIEILRAQGYFDILRDYRVKKMDRDRGISEKERRRWNVTRADLPEIEEALEGGGIFTDPIVETAEYRLKEINESLRRIREGDFGGFDILPGFLKEYYGRKSLQELLGSDEIFPPLDDALKEKLAGKADRQAFHYAVRCLLERTAENPEEKDTAERLMDYDEYMDRLERKGRKIIDFTETASKMMEKRQRR